MFPEFEKRHGEGAGKKRGNRSLELAGCATLKVGNHPEPARLVEHNGNFKVKGEADRVQWES